MILLCPFNLDSLFLSSGTERGHQILKLTQDACSTYRKPPFSKIQEFSSWINLTFNWLDYHSFIMFIQLRFFISMLEKRKRAPNPKSTQDSFSIYQKKKLWVKFQEFPSYIFLLAGWPIISLCLFSSDSSFSSLKRERTLKP